MENPVKYSFTDMQYDYALDIAEKRTYGNFSDPGTGKTGGVLCATRLTESKICLIICPKDVMPSWVNGIEDFYPYNSKIFVNDRNLNTDDRIIEFNKKFNNIILFNDINKIGKLSKDTYNYVIINYDKFSYEHSANRLINNFTKYNIPDFIGLDEIHFVKSTSSNLKSGKKAESYRRKYCFNLRKEIELVNPQVYVTGLTGTPLLNNLIEVRSLIEFLTGKEHPEIEKIYCAKNIFEAHKLLTIYGMYSTFVPKNIYNRDIITNNKNIIINSNDIIDEILQIESKKGNHLKIEQKLISKKLENKNVQKEFTKGTILYFNFVDSLIDKAANICKKLNLKVGFYTGRNTKTRNKDLNDFIKGNIDILIASKPISTGVDGLQKVSNKIIIFSYPYTGAEYNQLIARIIRKGCIFDTIDIIHVWCEFNYKDLIWCYDKGRYGKLCQKTSMMEIVRNGDFDKIDEIKVDNYAKEQLEILKNGFIDYSDNFNDILSTYSEQEYTYSKKYTEEIHRRQKTSTSDNFKKWCNEHPEKMLEYHKNREISKTSWKEDPVDIIGKKINERNDDNIIVDMGCGTAKLNKIINKEKNKVISIDIQNVTNDIDVKVCNMKDTSEFIENNSIDITVFCLSLWCTDYIDYIKEAYRITGKRGIMYIVEPIDEFDNDKLTYDIKCIGFDKTEEEIRDRFIYYKFIKN